MNGSAAAATFWLVLQSRSEQQVPTLWIRVSIMPEHKANLMAAGSPKIHQTGSIPVSLTPLEQ